MLLLPGPDSATVIILTSLSFRLADGVDCKVATAAAIAEGCERHSPAASPPGPEVLCLRRTGTRTHAAALKKGTTTRGNGITIGNNIEVGVLFLAKAGGVPVLHSVFTVVTFAFISAGDVVLEAFAVLLDAVGSLAVAAGVMDTDDGQIRLGLLGDNLVHEGLGVLRQRGLDRFVPFFLVGWAVVAADTLAAIAISAGGEAVAVELQALGAGAFAGMGLLTHLAFLLRGVSLQHERCACRCIEIS